MRVVRHGKGMWVSVIEDGDLAFYLEQKSVNEFLVFTSLEKYHILEPWAHDWRGSQLLERYTTAESAESTAKS